MNAILERILKLMDEKNISMSEMCKLAQIPQSTFSTWKSKDREPKAKYLNNIANVLDVSVDYLTTGEAINLKNHKITDLIYEIVNKQMQEKLQSPHPYISILGRVIAGVPVESVEDIIGKIQINEKLARTGNFYALEVKGNSMQPRLQEGDVVVVKEQSDVENGQIAIVCVNGDEYTIKKIKKSENGITLIPFNPAYDTIFYSNEEIEKLPVEIKGRVVQFHGNL